MQQQGQESRVLKDAERLSRSNATPTTIIQPSRGLLSLKLGGLWRYRELLYFLTWRDVKIRYKQAVLGFLWAFIQPFLKMVVFSVVFGGLVKMDSEGFPYPIFLYAGLLPWQFFADAVNRSGQSIVSTAFWDIPVEDNAFVILRNERNQVAFLHSSATQWNHRFSLEICLEQGYININGLLTSTRSYGDESVTFAKRQLKDEPHAFDRPREETISFDRGDSWSLEIEDFVRVIKEEQSVTSGNSHDALRVMQLMGNIYPKGSKV